MSETKWNIQTVRPAETEGTVAALTLAFCDDPFVRFMFPTAAQHLAVFPVAARAFGRAAFAHGTGRSIQGGGAALWLPSPLNPDEEGLASVMADVDGGARTDAVNMLAAMAEYRPSAEHWYLPLIGVEPTARGEGRGSALLSEALVRADAEHMPVYLDSTNTRNVPFYQRHGFEVLDTIVIGSSPPVRPMLRAAQ